MNSIEMLIDELRNEIRELHKDVMDVKATAKTAKEVAEATDKKLDAMRNRGYGFLGGVTLLAGAAGAKLQSVFFGS